MTAATVAGLLLGSTALNALADARGGHEHQTSNGNGQATGAQRRDTPQPQVNQQEAGRDQRATRVEVTATPSTATSTPGTPATRGDEGRGNRGNAHEDRATAAPTATTTATVTPTDAATTATPTATSTAADQAELADNKGRDHESEDLVTAAARVTSEVRHDDQQDQNQATDGTGEAD